VRALLLLALAGCPAKRTVVENIALPPAGTTLAVYLGKDPGSAIALIDDRQHVAVANHAILLDRIEPGAHPILIEPLDDRQPFRIGACTRERVANSSLDLLGMPRVAAKSGQPRQRLPTPPPGVVAPQLRCAVTASPGPRLVRVVQHAPLPGFQTFHEAHYDGGARAKLTTRFVLKSPAWGKQRASLTVFDGLPGGDRSPSPIARGEVVLDGTTTVLANPPIDVPARLRVIYDGGVASTVSPTDLAWRRDSKTVVATVLELDGAELPAGQIGVHFSSLQLRDATVAQRDRERIGDTLRLPLDAVTALRGERRTTADRTGKLIEQRITITVSNVSDDARPVSIEEQLRPGVKHTRLELPPTAKLVGDTVRADVVVPPHGNQRIEIKVTYLVGR
jgi:hypothetical protein